MGGLPEEVTFKLRREVRDGICQIDTGKQSIKKQRHHLATKVHTVKAMAFPVVVYGYESERRHLRVPWTARRSNQSTPKDISPEYSLEGLMLKLQYFGHLM